MAQRPITWKTLVLDVVRSMPRTFTLRDVNSKREHFARHYPDNRFVEAKIRQSLQILRNQGLIRFAGKGRYEKIADQPAFSPFFDPTVAAEYVSRAQVARVSVETWAEHNLYCLNCSNDELLRLPNNTEVADFECESCDSRYQLKSKNGRFGSNIPGAEYKTTIRAVRSGAMPNHVLVEYDPRLSVVVFVSGIPGPALGEDRVIARAPLKETARRAGWQGCQIRIEGLDRVYIVQPAGLQEYDVRRKWRELGGRAAF